VTTFVTTILVDLNDPSFKQPTKPVGRVLPRDDMDRHMDQEGWILTEVAPGRFRRLVPSPYPRRIMEIESIQRAVAAGELVIACGGGGIPVVRNPQEVLHGIAAVIDKDLASALLATQLDADAMMILTNVDRVSINYGKPDEQAIDSMTLSQAKQWLGEGQFPPGSMGPKIEGAVNFLEASRKPHAYVIIAPLHQAVDAVAGRIGTRITKQ
jgi:carbamate kinase